MLSTAVFRDAVIALDSVIAALPEPLERSLRAGVPNANYRALTHIAAAFRLARSIDLPDAVNTLNRMAYAHEDGTADGIIAQLVNIVAARHYLTNLISNWRIVVCTLAGPSVSTREAFAAAADGAAWFAENERNKNIVDATGRVKMLRAFVHLHPLVTKPVDVLGHPITAHQALVLLGFSPFVPGTPQAGIKCVRGWYVLEVLRPVCESTNMRMIGESTNETYTLQAGDVVELVAQFFAAVSNVEHNLFGSL